jgi:hypothetical protein
MTDSPSLQFAHGKPATGGAFPVVGEVGRIRFPLRLLQEHFSLPSSKSFIGQVSTTSGQSIGPAFGLPTEYNGLLSAAYR